MAVFHANDSFFWVVLRFSRMSVSLNYRAQILATLVQGGGDLRKRPAITPC